MHEQPTAHIAPPTLETLANREKWMLDEALHYATCLDKPIFPVSSQAGSKKPLIAGGHNAARNDRTAIANWWGTYKGAMIGLPTGKQSGILAVDIDMKNGKDGLAALTALEEKYGKLPATFCVATPSGGFHLYFLMPKNTHIPCSVSLLGEGIDIRADGGYVVAAGSVNDAWEEYCVVDNTPVSAPPAWLIELITKPKEIRKPVFADGAIPEGQRNNNLTRILGSLRAYGMNHEGLAAMALIINKQCCKPPLPEKEALDIADSIGRRPRSYAFNQMGNADRFIERYSSMAKCLNRKDWYVWEDGVWKPDAKSQVYEWAKQIAIDLKTEADSLSAGEAHHE